MKLLSFRNDILPLKDELYRLALRITQNHAEAQDVVQETLIKVWNQRDQWADIASVAPYCLTICRHLAIDHCRRSSRQPLPLDAGDATADTSWHANPEQQLLSKDRMARLRQLISRLPEKQQTCLQLRDVEGHSYQEIATIMDISEEQVKVNIFRARQALKKMISTGD